MKNNLPPVAILAGGLGTRLHGITQERIPKALVNVNGKPFLDHQLRLLRSQGINHIVLCVGHKGEMVHEFAGTGKNYELKIEYVFDGDTLLGTGGAIKNAIDLLGDTFFILYGDSYLLCDYYAVYDAYIRSNKLALMTVYQNQSKWDTSNVLYFNGIVKHYNKHNPTTDMIYIDYGLTLANHTIFDDVPLSEATDLSDIYHRLSLDGNLAGYETTHRFYEIGTPNGLKQLELFLKKQIHKT